MKRALSVLLVAIMVITSITVATAASKTSLTAKKITVFYKNAGGSWWASSRNSKRTEYYANIQYEGNGSFTTNVRVEHNSKTLKKNKDYTIGKISTIKGINTVKSVKIKGKGNYKDTITLYYGIAPSHPQIVLDTVKQKNSTTIEIKANYKYPKGSKKINYWLYNNNTKKYLFDKQYSVSVTDKWKLFTLSFKGKLNSKDKFTFGSKLVGAKSWLLSEITEHNFKMDSTLKKWKPAKS